MLRYLRDVRIAFRVISDLLLFNFDKVATGARHVFPSPLTGAQNGGREV
jgi:hypothetical protein